MSSIKNKLSDINPFSESDSSEDETENEYSKRKNDKKKAKKAHKAKDKEKRKKEYKTRKEPVDSSDQDSDSTDDETSSNSSDSSTQNSEDEDAPITRGMLKKLLRAEMDREEKLKRSQRFAKSCITAPNKYLVKGTHINHKKMTKVLQDLGSRKGLPELQMNNLCSFLDGFRPMIKHKFKKGKPFTNAEFNYLLIQFFGKEVKIKFQNENIEYRKVSSDTFLRELSTLIYERTPTIENVMQEINDYVPNQQSRDNILAMLSDLKKIVSKVPSQKWREKKRNKIIFNKIQEYLSHSQKDSLLLTKTWDHIEKKYVYPDYYTLKDFLVNREMDINGYLKSISKQRRF